MKIAIVATSGISLLNFRGALIKNWISQGHEVIGISLESAEEMKDITEQLGITYYQVAGSRTGIGLFSGLKMISMYRKAFEELKPDYCFLYMSKPIAFGCPAAKKAKVPHINVLINGLENAFYRKGLKDMIVRFVMKRGYAIASRASDNVFVQNTDDRDLLVNCRAVSADKVKVLNGSGVDMVHFTREPLPEEPVFLMVARLLWSKGIREYMTAIAKVKEKHPNARFMLVGGLDHNDESLSKEELDRCIADYDIEYCGFAKDVRPFIKKSSVFVLPSYHEGTPRSVLEAMAMGRAIITTAAPGCRDTVEEGVNGYLVPVGDSDLLAKRMCALIEDKALRESMGDQSYRICTEKYDVNLVNAEIDKYMFDAKE